MIRKIKENNYIFDSWDPQRALALARARAHRWLIFKHLGKSLYGGD